MSKWNLPPKGGHLDLPDGIYLQNMNMLEIPNSKYSESEMDM